jgi:hypothetical protein
MSDGDAGPALAARLRELNYLYQRIGPFDSSKR